MLDRVQSTISRHGMLRTGERVIAAVSGGPDSICLLEVLREIGPRIGVTLSGVAHLNHKLRGQASDEEECFVAARAAHYGLPFYREEANVAGLSGNLENAARRTRLAFFARLLGEGHADRVATGHTRDDQAETVLFRVLRGAGPAGLAGILPVTEEGLIRPLLDVTRVEIVDFLRSRGISWREDQTNFDPRFARNRIRSALLPQLARDWNPRIAEALAHAADIAQEEERWWAGEIRRIAAKLLVERDGGIEACAADIAALPRAVARRLVKQLISGGLEDVERVLALAARPRGEGTLELAGMRVTRSFNWVRFSRSVRSRSLEPVPEPVTVMPPARHPWPGGLAVCFEIVETTTPEAKYDRNNCVSLKVQGEHTPLELRTWRVGDHYRPAGRSREYTIKELFQRARVPSWRRASWPIVSTGSRIVWVRQFGTAAGFAAPGGSDAASGRLVLRIREEKEKDAPAESHESK